MSFALFKHFTLQFVQEHLDVLYSVNIIALKIAYLLKNNNTNRQKIDISFFYIHARYKGAAEETVSDVRMPVLQKHEENWSKIFIT